MRPGARLPAVALLLAAAGSAAAQDAPPEHPALEQDGERLVEFSGGIEAGIRWVTGEDGRYAQDVNLDDGFRLLAVDLEGHALRPDLAFDSLDLHGSGFGDPERRVDFDLKRIDLYDLRAHADRSEFVFLASYDPHPFDTVRRSDGVSLEVRPATGLALHYTQEHIRREGDASLEQRYRDDQTFPVAATIAYDGRFQTAGFDASSGVLRFGGTWAWSDASDDSLRTLDRPDTPVPDQGTYRNVSDIDAGTATGRAGLRLFGGKADLGVVASYGTSRTRSTVRGDEVTTPAGVEYSDETRGTTESDSRTRMWRADLLVLPHPDWEALARVERRWTDADGDADIETRTQTPAHSDPSEPFSPVSTVGRTSTEDRLARESLETRWRASKQWRLRGGVERVDERVTTRDPDWNTWEPRTTAATAGFDFVPSDRFDASLLARHSETARAATALSAATGDSLSARLRARRPDGWHATWFARVKQRSDDSSDAFTTYDSYGFAMGRDHARGFAEFSVTREDFTLASDTAFVVDSTVIATKTPQRVRYDEAVTSATFDFSQEVSGPLRAFGSARWADANGDLPYDQYDASLGLGWRLCPSTELRLEGREVVFNESRRMRDDYRARIVTVSVRWEF